MKVRIALLAALVAGPSLVGADELVLKNGDKVSGKVLSLDKGSLSFETPYAGVLKVKWDQVASVKTDGKVKVRLATKELLEGKLSPGGEGRLQVAVEGAAAPVEVEMDKVARFNEPGVQWHGSLNVAARATDGNTDTEAGLIAGEATRTTDNDVFLVRCIVRYGRKNGELQERNGYALGKYQKTITAGLYGFISAEFLSDRFKDLYLGTVLSVGVGYEILKEGWIDLAAEAGIAYFDNVYREIQEDESHVGGRFSSRLRVALPLGFEFKDLFTFYPNFEETDDWQIRNEATLGTQIGGGWSLLGGVITEFDNEPPAGLEEMDNTYFVGLGYKF